MMIEAESAELRLELAECGQRGDEISGGEQMKRGQARQGERTTDEHNPPQGNIGWIESRQDARHRDESPRENRLVVCHS